MLIGDEGIGYYQMAYPLYLFFIAVSSGIPVAISKMVSERNAIGDNEGIIQVFRKSLILMIFIGGGFTAIILILSKFIVRIFNWDYKSYYSLLGVSIAPVFISIMSTFRGFFQGMQNMTPTAVSTNYRTIRKSHYRDRFGYSITTKGYRICCRRS